MKMDCLNKLTDLPTGVAHYRKHGELALVSASFTSPSLS